MMETRTDELRKLFLKSAIAARDAARAERDAARAEAVELRTAATEFANTMAALSPIWNVPMRQAWDKLFAVVDATLASDNSSHVAP